MWSVTETRHVERHVGFALHVPPHRHLPHAGRVHGSTLPNHLGVETQPRSGKPHAGGIVQVSEVPLVLGGNRGRVQVRQGLGCLRPGGVLPRLNLRGNPGPDFVGDCVGADAGNCKLVTALRALDIVVHNFPFGYIRLNVFGRTYRRPRYLCGVVRQSTQPRTIQRPRVRCPCSSQWPLPPDPTRVGLSRGIATQVPHPNYLKPLGWGLPQPCQPSVKVTGKR